MTKKKNKFLTFCFSLIPGAGEMYLGFMKRGISLMTLFFASYGIAGYLDIPVLLFVSPIFWFYSFFEVHNLNALTDEEFYAIEDDFLFHTEFLYKLDRAWSKKSRKIIAAVLIFLGVTILWNSCIDVLFSATNFFSFSENAHYLIRTVGYSVPKIVIGIAIAVLGIGIVREKKAELHDEQEDSN